MAGKYSKRRACKGKELYIMYEGLAGPRAKDARQKQLDATTIIKPQLLTTLVARDGNGALERQLAYFPAA
jgi:hypothetical protein